MRLIIPLSLLSFILLAVFISSSANGSSQLLKNNGFEQGVDYWLRSGPEASITDAPVHSGRYALRTQNGVIWQSIQVEPHSTVKMTLWVFLKSIPGSGHGTTEAAVTVTAFEGATEFNVSYCVSTPNPPKDDNTIIMTSEIQRDQWAFVERNLRDDMIDSHPEINFDNVQKIGITIWSKPTVDPLPYWDDISLTSEQVTEPTTTSPTTSPTPTTTPTSTTATVTTTADTTVPLPSAVKQEAEGFWKEDYTMPALATIALIAIVGSASVTMRRKAKAPRLPQRPSVKEKSTATVSAKKYCISCGAELDANKSYCIKCGAHQIRAETGRPEAMKAPEVTESSLEPKITVEDTQKESRPLNIDIDYDKLAEKVVEKMPKKPVVQEPTVTAMPAEKPMVPETRGGYCTSCGAPLRAGARFCTRCGSGGKRAPFNNRA